MKKALPLLLIAVLICSVFSGCQGTKNVGAPDPPTDLHGIRIDTAALGANATLQVEYTDSDPDIALFLAVLSHDYLCYEIYGISATNNGAAVKPAAQVDITFPLPIGFHPAKHVIETYLMDENGDFYEIAFTLVNGAITVSSADLGRFVLALSPANASVTSEINVSYDIELFLPALNKMLTNGLPSLDMTNLTAQAALTFLYYAERDSWGFSTKDNSDISISLDHLQRYAAKWFGVEYDFQFPTSFSGAEVTLADNMVTFHFLGESSGSPLVVHGGYQNVDSDIYKVLLFEPEIVTKCPGGILGFDYWEGDQPGTYIIKGAAHSLNIKNMGGYWQLISFA